MNEEVYEFCDNKFLLPVIAKLKRTDKQIENIKNDLAGAGVNLKVDSLAEIDPDRMGYKVIIQSLLGLSIDDISMQVGECAHNLRSSLDNLAYALARLKSDPPLDIKQIAFPIFSNEKDFKAKWSKARLEKTFPQDVISVMLNIQPYNRKGGAQGTPEQDPLCLLSSLNNADKHRLPHLVVFAQDEIKFSGIVEYKSEQGCKDDGPPNVVVNISPLIPGFTLLESKTKNPIAKIKGKFDIIGKIKLELEGQYYDVERYLADTRRYVIMVCKLFDHFFRVKCD